MFGDKHIHTRFMELNMALDTKSVIFDKVLTLNNYTSQHRLFKYNYNYNNCFDWPLEDDDIKADPLLNLMEQHNFFYPTRIGYVPKRLAMWQILMILKM